MAVLAGHTSSDWAGQSSAIEDAAPRKRRSAVTWLALAAVALTFATSGIVFSEPAPVDALSIGLIVLLPTIGLVSFNRGLLAFGTLWLIAGACALLAATLSLDQETTAIHVAVTIYLYAACFVIAGFVAYAPRAHTKLILGAWTLAAIVAAAAALAGYFGLLPGAADLFTRYGRAAGTFKDPNVLGPFLIVPIIYQLGTALERPLHRMILPLAIAGFLMLAVFLSFSRGAWFVLALSLAIYGYLALVTASRAIVRLKIIGLLALGSILALGVVAAALSNDKVAELVSQRASLEQSYDTGSEGRFGGQQKALGLIAENPLGIGAQEFTSRYHHEEVHNVYLTLFLSAGWLGGSIYLIVVVMTIVLGFRHLLRATPTRPLFLIVYATFVATALEGLIIDTDHWRHFYVLLALIWGMMTATQPRHAHLRANASTSASLS
ncbi:O-antigen ligase family protein [Hyphomicrobium sp. 1Nfss2.1]|uniref:O-antigen ligase family protein n=1 Tax=Hyphomicrobium sp. 1Nfss2.1 TaxID=3413936 RepID=UPI003C7B5F18